jgi:hypothetical protein
LRARGWRLLGGLLLLLPFAAPILVIVRADVEQRGVKNIGAAEGRLLSWGDSHRVVLFAESQPQIQIFNAKGERVGQLAPVVSASVVSGPFVDWELKLVLYLGGIRTMPIRHAHAGILPLAGGSRRFHTFRLPGPVPLVDVGGHPALLEVPSPLALACPPATVLLRTSAGWVRLESDGPPPKGAPERAAPLFSGDLPAVCREMKRMPIGDGIPAHTELLHERWLHGDPYTLSASVSPPSFLELLGPERRVPRVIQPPVGVPVWGSALTAGRWVLFHGRACQVGEQRFTLSDLDDPEGRPRVWSKLLPMDRFAGCRPDLPPAAWICSGGDAEPTIQLDLRGDSRAGLSKDRDSRAWRLRDGAPATVIGGAERSGCEQMRPLRRRAARWEGGRTLDAGGIRYRVSAAPPRLRATRSGMELWRYSPQAPGYIVGVTARDLLLVIPPTRLEVIDRATGRLRLVQEEPRLHNFLEAGPRQCEWIGHLGETAFFLISGSRSWLVPVRVSDLAVFDGKELRIAE